eukprot:SAG31_NODE_6788_length_1888_cov_1.050307_1_plen_223_part_10
MVLLKNDGNLLPLNAQQPLRIALIGPHLNTTADLLSSHGYAGENKLVSNNTIKAAFQRYATATGAKVKIVGAAIGCDIVMGCTNADLGSIKTAVATTDVILAFVGLHPSTGAPNARGYGKGCSEGEAWDRGDIALCGEQNAILAAAKNASSAPLITIMINGGTISASWIKSHSTAVLESWYPGQAGGEAVAAVVFGDRAPGGRLPVTIYDAGFIKDASRNITN